MLKYKFIFVITIIFTSNLLAMQKDDSKDQDVFAQAEEENPHLISSHLISS